MNKRVGNIGIPASIKIADRVRKLEASGILASKMQIGEPCFDTPEYIITATSAAISAAETHYASSVGISLLRKAISSWEERKYGLHIIDESIRVFSGGVHAIFCALTSVFNSEDEVVIPKPYWPQYANISKLAGTNVVEVNTKETDGKVTLDQLKESITNKTRMIIVNNPANFTGITYGTKEVGDFIKLAKDNDSFILFDEVHSELIWDGEFCSCLQTPNYDSDHVIYINSFSKYFSMTGWRVGYAVLPAQIIDIVTKVSQNTITNVVTFNQFAAAVGMNKWGYNIDVFVSMFRMCKAKFEEIKGLLKLKGIKFIKPSGAFYFFICCEQDSLPFSFFFVRKGRNCCGARFSLRGGIWRLL